MLQPLLSLYMLFFFLVLGVFCFYMQGHNCEHWGHNGEMDKLCIPVNFITDSLKSYFFYQCYINLFCHYSCRSTLHRVMPTGKERYSVTTIATCLFALFWIACSQNFTHSCNQCRIIWFNFKSKISNLKFRPFDLDPMATFV